MSTSKEEKKINQRNAEGNRDGWWESYHSNGQLWFLLMEIVMVIGNHIIPMAN